jgi:hypothetical protein
MEDTGRRVGGGGSVRDIEEECYLRIEPLSCEWSKKTARFSPCSSLLSMGLFSPLFLFFLSILLSSDSFLSSFFSFFFLTIQFEENYSSEEVGQVSEGILGDCITVYR